MIKMTDITEGVNVGKFGVGVDEARKEVVLAFDGFFNGSGTPAFMRDYEGAKKRVNPSSSTLIIDAKNLKPFPPEVLDHAGAIYRDYTQFNKIYVIKPDNITAKMQMDRIFKKENVVDRFEVVKSVAECR